MMIISYESHGNIDIFQIHFGGILNLNAEYATFLREFGEYACGFIM